MSLAESMATVKVSKATKEEGKHYIPFSKEEWAKMEASVGTLQPKDLKRMLQMVFEGHAQFIVSLDPKVYIESLEKLLKEAKEAAAKTAA